jgi:hypothetical protein
MREIPAFSCFEMNSLAALGELRDELRMEGGGMHFDQGRGSLNHFLPSLRHSSQVSASENIRVVRIIIMRVSSILSFSSRTN